MAALVDEVSVLVLQSEALAGMAIHVACTNVLKDSLRHADALISY